MPGPDYPWATYLPGAIWQPRPGNAAIKAVVLHARHTQSPEQLAALRGDPAASYHYLVTASGGVVQFVPERGMTAAIGRVVHNAPRDRFCIHVCLQGDPQQLTWPDDQVAAVSRLLSVIVSTRGAMPVRDAANLAAPRGRFAELSAWPWIDMLRRVIRLDTPIERIYAAMIGEGPITAGELYDAMQNDVP